MTEASAPARAVVLHVVDAPEDLDRAIGTSRALQANFPGVRVRIVVNGPALQAIPAVNVSELPEHVGVAACSIGLQRREIATADVPDGVDIVPAAPLVIVEEQFNGAAYIRL